MQETEELWPELTTIELFAALFEGNMYRYGTEEGGSIGLDADWDDLAELHLAGQIDPLGVYPIDPQDGKCKWGCIDFDEGDEESYIHALNVQNMLELEGVTAWIERSRSKGYHVWVFCREWVDPQIMRNALLYVCDFMDAPTKEINPKQTKLSEDQVGNYVRLPYPGALHADFHKVVTHAEGQSHGARRVMVDDETYEVLPIALEWFVRRAYDSRVEPKQLERLARHWVHKPPHPKPQITYIASDEDVEVDEDLIERLTKKARSVYDNGPRFVNQTTGRPDRSEALCYLAGQIARDKTHDEDECKRVLVSADIRWGKYTDRGDGDIRLDDIVQRAFMDTESFY